MSRSIFQSKYPVQNLTSVKIWFWSRSKYPIQIWLRSHSKYPVQKMLYYLKRISGLKKIWFLLNITTFIDFNSISIVYYEHSLQSPLMYVGVFNSWLCVFKWRNLFWRARSLENLYGRKATKLCKGVEIGRRGVKSEQRNPADCTWSFAKETAIRFRRQNIFSFTKRSYLAKIDLTREFTYLWLA